MFTSEDTILIILTKKQCQQQKIIVMGKNFIAPNSGIIHLLASCFFSQAPSMACVICWLVTPGNYSRKFYTWKHCPKVQLLFSFLYHFNRKAYLYHIPTFGVRTGPGKPGKSWNFLDWKVLEKGHWSWKVLEIV